ncbi:fibroblast growth factor receptor 1-like isoform X1 [Branchiostoma floridae x Branchiostoma belcheri]
MPSSDVVYAEVGSAVELRCDVGAVPQVNESFWSWTESDGNRTALWSNGTKHRFSAYQLLSARGVTMVLAIDNVMPDDFTHYTCTAINRFGQDSRVLMLKPSMGTTYPSLSLPLLVGLGCSACVVCLVLLYFTKRCCHLVRKTEENDQFEIEDTILQPLNGTSNGHAVRFQSMDVTDSTIHLQTPVDNARSEFPVVFTQSQDTRAGQNSSNIPRHIEEEVLVGPDIHGQSEYQLPHENDHITYMYHSRNSEAHVVEPEGRDMEFNPDQITFLEELGEGQFGKVHKAKAHFVHDQARSSTMIVAVKTVKAHASSEVRDDMLKELRMMMRLLDPHPNVVTLLGYCTKSDPVMLVVEYVPNGDLLSFLRNDRASRNVTYANLHTESRTLQNTDLISFAWQVSKGMCYLASKQCIHRDLAARNVLVGKNKTCKVSDFGLARDGPEYKKVKDSPLPLRWMAPETLSLERLYTTKSDVWSFGVLLYEIVTLGSTPYPTMSAQQAALEVQMGMVLQKPAHCTDDL